MAQLHRRILRLPHRRKLAAAAALAALCAGAPAPVRAQPRAAPAARAPITDGSLALEARALRDPARRDAALETLCNVPAEGLAAVRERISDLRGTRPTGDAGYAAMGEFGEAAGAAGPSDPRDLLPGLLVLPDARFSPTHVIVAERYCLVRSLERMATAEALVAALPLLTYEIRAFRWQARHVVRRSGKLATAMVVRAASNPNAEVDLWAGWALQTLGIRDSGDSVQGQTEESLIEVLRAYASVRHIGGMPVVASFVDDPRFTVRTAARDALALYGENSVWELRRLFQTRLGQDPGNRSWQLLLRDLSRELDDRREAPLRARAERAVVAMNSGRADEAASLADALLVDAPIADATRTLAPVFLARARAAAASGRIDEARSMVERALRLGPTTPLAEALALRDQIRDAELVRHGIVEEATERPVIAANAAQASIAGRRAYARLGLLAAFVLLSAQTWFAFGRRASLEAAMRAARLRSELVRRYREGGRERILALLAGLRTAGASGARASFESTRTLLEKAREFELPRAEAGAIGLPVGDVRTRAIEALGRARAAVGPTVTSMMRSLRGEPSKRPASRTVRPPAAAQASVAATHPASVPVPAQVAAPARPSVPRVAEMASVPEIRSPSMPPRVAAASRPAPTTPDTAGTVPAARQRKERPTRRAVADAELFTGNRETAARRRAT